MTGGEDRFGSDYLGLLVEAQHDANEKQRILADEVVDDCKTFYMPGQETTTTLLSWTVLLLAVHTDWQEEERKEVIQLFGKQSPHPDGIAKLKTVRKSRTQSIAFASGRNIFSIKFEILICYLLFHFHADDSMTLRLNPPPTNNNIGAFIPFGLGPRTCVGLNFGTLRQRLLCQ
ncbi:cytochrome P450 CYP749A22 [Prunus yedoensis var. nudiflora]|uniref:Cytochrome P450 CYP749A22 n=1 Tax=Prunus yedoensis var. nudiflora TaxID=2094558 RepID=A0A314UR16_PRUYE|nr:cytochrome P450 CYP749A22 [Prunus yedoensis var. nudiflora]